MAHTRYKEHRLDRPYLVWTVLYLFGLVAIVVLADLGIAGRVFSAARSVPFGDKLGHLVLMGLFSFFLNTALRGRTVRVRNAQVLLGSMIVFALVLVEELSQLWIASRRVEILDLVFDVAGIYLFGLLAVLGMRMKQAASDAQCVAED